MEKEREFEDILYEKKDGVARITINRPEQLNAFTMKTIAEMVEGFEDAGIDPTIGVVVLTGAGDRAFCVGGDREDRSAGGGVYQNYKGIGVAQWTNKLHDAMRYLPQPLIARVNGYAVGHGNILNSICDLSIASETARFAQVGPRVGATELGGWGQSLLVRNIGDKKAREMWYLCRQYSAQEALEMGLVNRVVPQDKLDEEVDAWCKEILDKSPTALKRLKLGFNALTEQYAAFDRLEIEVLPDFWSSAEGLEGVKASVEKRKPDWSKFRK